VIAEGRLTLLIGCDACTPVKKLCERSLRSRTQRGSPQARRQAASSIASAAVSALPCGSMPTLLISCVTVPSTSASTQAAR
jgi:hypothetical protein